MTTKSKDVGERLKGIVEDLLLEYEKAHRIYSGAGLEVELKQNALQSMANILQLKQAAISNYANWMHVLRQEKKMNKKG